MNPTRLLPPSPHTAARPPGLRPTWAEVDLDALVHNARVLRDIADGAELMAVVKADGYGHGAVPVARAALRGGATWLAVALIEEAVELRDAGITAPILLFTEPPVAAIPTMLGAGVTPTVYSPSFIAALDRAAAHGQRSGHVARAPLTANGQRPADGRRDDGRLAVHCKLDTGMRRVGVPEADWEAVLRQLADSDALRVEGLWSHLACADELGHPSIDRQSQAFRRGLDLAGRLGLAPSLRHLCNSAGLLTRPGDHYDLVRAGVALYGLDPGNGVIGDAPVRPVMRWVSQVSLAKRVAAGEAVSYGHRWAPARETTVATVPVGYADGVTRAFGGRGSVVAGGRPRPVVGRVCMDQLLFDAGDDDVRAGDEVVLLGDQGDASVTAEQWAAWLDTITYEVVCTVGRRVPRVHVGGDPDPDATEPQR